MKQQWIMKEEQDTKAFGELLSKQLVPGDVVALIGDLGTGKTALTKAVAAGLGVNEMITSPTFTIVCEYHEGRMPLYHFDVYRVYDPDELFEIGFEEYLFGGGVCLIEWADLIEDILPAQTIRIEIQYGTEMTERIYEISWPEGRDLQLEA